MKQQKQAELAGQKPSECAGAVRKRRRAVVTGATGFLGTALCRELLAYGYEVTAVIRPGSRKREKLEALLESAQELELDKEMQASGLIPGEGNGRLQMEELPLGELSRLAERGLQADVFYHLAWNGSSGQEREQFDIQVTNVSYTAEAIRAARKCGCRTFVGAGSQAEYGIVHGKAKEKETVPKPFMLYGAAKLAAYEMGRLVAQQEGISFIWPRIYSIYGPGENPGTLVSYLVEALREGEVPQVTECENLWDFTYIDDCARMLRMLGESQEAEGVYNLSAGEPRPLKEFVEEIRDVVKPGVEVRFGAKKSDPQRTFWLDPEVSRIQEICGTCQTCFQDGIQKKAHELSAESEYTG